MSTLSVSNIKHPSAALNNIILDANGNASVAGTIAMGTPFTHRNRLINGSFDIWQRGTSGFGVGSNTYNADRWCSILIDYAGGGASFERGAFTPGQTTVPGNPTYFLRFNNTNLTTGAGGLIINEQRIEDVASLSGQSVTLSGWVRRSSGTAISLQINQEFGSGGSSPVYTNITPAITTSSAWTYFSRTFTVPSVSGKTIGASSYTALRFIFVDKASFAGTAISDVSAGGTVDFAMLQLEVGTVATPFERRMNELQLCQRYFEKSYNTGVAPGTAGATDGQHAVYISGASSFFNGGGNSVCFAVEKRTPPTVTTYSGVTGISGKIRDYMANADVNSNIGYVSTRDYFGYASVTQASAINMYWQWTASAEL